MGNFGKQPQGEILQIDADGTPAVGEREARLGESNGDSGTVSECRGAERMRSLRATWARIREVFGVRRLNRELEEELAAHVEMHVADRVRAGISPERAEREALMKLGGLEQAKDSYREAAGFPFLEAIVQDVHFAVRTLRKIPGFTAVAVLTLALGIGANIAVFSIVNNLLLRPLPFANAGQLVWFTGNHGQGGLSGVTYNVGSYEEYARHAQSFESVTCYQAFWGSSEFNVTGHGEPRHIEAVMVANNFFSTL